MGDWWSPGVVSGVVGGLLTPLLMWAWGKAFPVAGNSGFDAVGFEELKRRNNWIDWISTALFFVGIGAGLATYAAGLSRYNPAGAAFGFGLMMWLPIVWLTIFSFLYGSTRLCEFLRFYELKHGVGRRGLGFAYIPLAIAALWCLFFALPRLPI
jgi:hypothetical protein